MLAYHLAYLLSIFRLPFAFVPYFAKLVLLYYLKDKFSQFWGKHSIQFVRVIGDFINFFITSASFCIAYVMIDCFVLKTLLILIVTAEFIRLVTEKGIMVFSAFWQIIPHRSIAQKLQSKSHMNIFKSYCRYYALSDERRLITTVRRLKAKARLLKMAGTSLKLRYVNSFQIVPDSTDLRSGNVRNVAQGIVYVHASWTNNPDILCGQALRRSPWIFDPRYLRRPFYYRTEANRLMTLFVFENARLCPLFAIYQFGHEIKSARYDAFFRVARWLGHELEEPVQADGTYKFDPFAKIIIRGRPKLKNNDSRSLWTDDEVLKQIADDPIPSALEIAEKYTYPLIYVKEVLLSKLLI